MGQVRAGVVSRSLVVLAWLALVPVIGAFILLRLNTSHNALLAAQVVFLVPVALAAVVAEFAYFFGPRGVERKAWGMLSLTVMVLLMSEGYYSWYQVSVSPAGPPSPSLYDVLNLIAALMIATTLVILSGVTRESPAQRLRLGCDALAVTSAVYAGLYHFWVRVLPPSTPWNELARWTGYSLVGFIVVVGTLWLASSAIYRSEREIYSLVGVSLLIFSAGMILWPVWRSGTPGTAGTLDVVVSAIYLLGYYLLMVAGLVRLRDARLPWGEDGVRPIRTEGVWPSTIVSGVVLVSIVAVAAWCYAAPTPSADLLPYLLAGILATFGLVGRTGVTAVETVLLRQQADLDAVTGLRNTKAFGRCLDQAVDAAARLGTRVSVIALDLDDFARINEGLGQAAGDGALLDVSRALARAVGHRGEAFHLGADEFAVLLGEGQSEAVALGADVLQSIEEVRPAGSLRLSASMGIAERASDLKSGEELLRRALAAEAWAKYHGKGRAVVFDERILRALGVEDRLKGAPESDRFGLVRALCAATDARDQRNYYHSRNVAALTVILCEALQLERAHIQRIEVAAMLHDCGKLCLPDDLLADQLLTSRRQLALREHASLGGTLTASIGVEGVSEWIRHHHERWDGAGYPDGLVGEAVPFESRIIALADAYDAMTSGMRNRSPLSRAAALQEVDLGMGSRFDPELAEVFITAVAATKTLGWSDEWSVA